MVNMKISWLIKPLAWEIESKKCLGVLMALCVCERQTDEDGQEDTEREAGKAVLYF